MAGVRRRWPGWATWLAVAFLVTPLLELFVVLQVGQVIGAWPTVVLLLAESALGAWILRREGPAAWRRLRGAMGQGRLPSDELADGALLLVGGTLLLTPGFITDAVGFFCVLPPTRPVARRALLAALRRRVAVTAFGASRRSNPRGFGTRGSGRPGSGRPGFGPPGRPTRQGPDDVVPGEVVNRPADDRPDADGDRRDPDDDRPGRRGPAAPGG